MKLGSILVAAALAGGLLSAQDQQRLRPRMDPGARGDFGSPMSERWLNKNLNLTAEQSNKVHTIFSEANVSRQADMTRMQTLHNSLTDAVKAGNESAIDSITRDMATMHQAQQATHAKTLAKIYATLTPDQQAKVATDIERAVGGPGPGMGRRGPGGPPPAKQQ
jgi:Spy/CpxP family protein refolding chaperone